MSAWKKESTATQLSEYLRGELIEGRWKNQMPGVMRLANELGVARKTVEAALRKLERQGLLRGQGPGRGRVIRNDGQAKGDRRLRIRVLVGEPADRSHAYLIDTIQKLNAEGHIAEFASKTQIGMGDRVSRIARFIEEESADAWIIFSGTRDVLLWFSELPQPSFALAGRANNVPIASIAPDKVTPMREAIKRLHALGHQRIVMLCRTMRRKPEPGLFERAFLDELRELGIKSSDYNLPDWEENIDGFHARLESLFKITPPTVLFIDEAPFLIATLQFCLRRGLRVPEDVSLICTDPDPNFEWCRPSISHLAWDSGPAIRRIIKWADNVRLGNEDLGKSFSKAHFFEGGTIGPATQQQKR